MKTPLTIDKLQAELQKIGTLKEDYSLSRKSPRAEFLSYNEGTYFVTICSKDKLHYFGEIDNEEMHFSQIGLYADKALSMLHTHYEYVEVLTYVVMPNHIHVVIRIKDDTENISTHRSALSVVVGGYKQSITRYAKLNKLEFGWQSRYHDHVIRGTNDLNNIVDYIKNNVIRWDTDCYK